MAVPTIALYASPPSSVCSPYSCQSNSHDFDLNGRSSSAATASSSSQRSNVGGLSCLFSSTSVRHTSTVGEDLLSSRPDELSSSFSYSPYSSFGSYMKRDQSPVSVFQGPISCSSSVGSSRSLPIRFSREKDVDLNMQSSLRSVNTRLFNGFVSHALGSCVDYDSPSFRTHDNSLDGDTSVLVDELTFNMEDSFTRSNSEPYAKDLLLGAQLRHKIFHEEVVVKAFYEAEKAHRGQVRASGDPYLQHCLETAILLAMMGANSTLVAAGLLHDTLDDSFMNYDYILTTFGAGVADLVEGVSKLSQLSKLARESNTASKTVEADRLHTMFLAMADARAVLIKLADRLHNMMTLDALPSSKRQRFAKETLEIFAPLANRLGIFSWKEQLENLCFKHLYPEQYQELSSKLVNAFDETKITSAVKKLEKSLKDASISYQTLSGRHKSLYSIYRKMLKKKLSMNEVHDIQGLRLIVEREEDCYKALEIVRGLWPEVPEKFKDYIKKPKCNGYQSIHTVVMGEDMVPLEVQMRTEAMHLKAEYGFAAHWRYKEGGDSKHSSYLLPMVEWARWAVSWHCETMIKDRTSIKPPPSSCTFPSHSQDCPYSYKPYHSGNDGPIFVILIENNKMSVQELPANSAVIDLVLGRGGSSRWTPYGLPVKEDLRPKVNHEPVSDPTFKLKMGDVVELTPIIPGKSLTEYREEIQRMYDQGRSLKTATMAAPRT